LGVEELIPKTGFFPDYIRYARELTDAPDEYHLAAALSVHSAVYGSIVEVQHLAVKTETAQDSRDQLLAWSPTHLWTIIIGDSGDRKTTALNKAEDVLDPFIEDRRGAIGSSPESTMDMVSNAPDTVFWYAEGAAFFSQFLANYWRQGQGVFPQLYDGRSIDRKLTGGLRTAKNPSPKPIHIRIERPRVTLTIGVALGHLAETRAVDWTGGLIPRMMIFHANRVRRQDSELINEEGQKRLQGRLRAVLNGLTAATKNGVYLLKVTPEAAEIHSAWSAKVDQVGQKRSERVRPTFNRIPDHVRRVAAHYAVSQGHSAVGPDSMVSACNLGNFLITSVDRVSELLSTDRVDRLATTVRDFVVLASGGVPGRPVPLLDVTRALRLSAHTLEPALKSLQKTGEMRTVAYQGQLGTYLVLPGLPDTKLVIVKN